MKVKSILKYRSYLYLIFLIYLLFGLWFLIPFYSQTDKINIYFYWFSIGAIIYVFYWILKGVINKTSTIVINHKGVYRKKFYGLGKLMFYSFEIYYQYETQKIRSRYKEYEFLLLLKDGKQYNICNNELYKNYEELKTAVKYWIENSKQTNDLS